MLDDESGFWRRKPVRRSAAERAAIVAESYEPGATVVGVARRHGIVPSQLSGWRTAARRRSTREKERPIGFAEVLVPPELGLAPHDGVEIIVDAVSIRLPKSTTPKRIADVARHLARQG